MLFKQTFSRRDGYTYKVFDIDAETNSIFPAFELPAVQGHIALDEHNNLFFGSEKGVIKLDSHGVTLPELPAIPLPRTGETRQPFPQTFSGNVMLTKDALWLATGMGYLARYSRTMVPDPGVVSQRNYALGYVTQIANGPAGSYYIRSEDALYQASIDGKQLVLQRRFGSLPRVDALAVTPNGYIGIGNSVTTTGMLWFAFNAKDPAAAPLRAEGPGPLAQGVVGMTPAGKPSLFSYSFADAMTPGDFSPRPRSIIGRFYSPIPSTSPDWPKPKAYGSGEYSGQLSALTRVGNKIFAIDSSTNTIVSSAGQELKFARVEGCGPFIGTLTSIASLGSSLLMVADGGMIRAYRIQAGNLLPKWQLSAFGKEQEYQFGDQLYLAASNGRLLVSDTKRHRLLLFACDENLAKPPLLLARFGVTNTAGDDMTHLSSPTLVSMSDNMAVVYDSGNQRVVKLLVR